MKRLIPRLKMNPIIVKEIRSRMRGPRAFITLTVMLLVMGGIMAAALQIFMTISRYNTVLSPQIGQAMFASLAFLILFMVCAITPAVTSGAISSEKEKQTYEMLMATPLSPTRILWGKLISAMSYVLLLLFASVPLASLVFLFGGVAPADMLRALLILLVVAVTLGILGMFMSALFGRTGRATVASFISVVVLMLGPMFIAVLVGVLRESEPPRWILAPSPISALAGALAPSLNRGGGSGFEIFSVLSGIWNLGVAPISQTDIPRPIYHYSLPLYLGMSLLLFMLTTRLVQPSRRWRMRRKELLTSLAVLLVFVAGVAAVFLATANRYEWALNGQPPAPTIGPVMVGPQFPGQAGMPAKEVVVQAVPAVSGQRSLSITIMPAKEVVVQAVPADQSTPESTGPTPEPSALPAELQSAPDIETQMVIYAAVVRQLYEVDHTFGDQAPNFPLVYLVQQTDDRIGDPNITQSDPVVLEEKIQAGIIDSLASLPAEIRWVASFEDVPKDPKSGEVGGKGAAIRLGNIHEQADGTVQVSASLYFSSMGATGKTYVLVNDNGVWKIIGTTGVEWIS